jgi:hypothetical protein
MTTTAIIKLEDIKIDLTQWKVLSVKAERIAEAITIDSDEEEQMAIDSCAEIKRFGKQIEEARVSEKAPFKEISEYIDGMFRPLIKSTDAAEEIIKGKIKPWRIKKEQIRQEEERKRQIEYQKKIAEEQARAKKEKREAEIIVPPPAIIETQTRGTTASAPTRKTWKAEITDPMLFIKAVADGKVPIEAIEIKASFINAQAKQYKRDGVYPGIKFFEDIDVSIRR